MIPHKQLSLAEIFEDCQNKFDNDKYSILRVLLLRRTFSIPTDTLLIIFLKFSKELYDFCEFDVVSDASKFTRFKQGFLPDLQSIFDHLVDLTEPICQKINPQLFAMTSFYL